MTNNYGNEPGYQPGDPNPNGFENPGANNGQQYQGYPDPQSPYQTPPAYQSPAQPPAGGYAAPDPYAAPQQQWSTPAPTPSPYASAAYSTPPNNNLVWAILSTVLCCLPLGVVSIVYSTQVNSKWAAGDYAGAQNSAKLAGQWAMWSAIAGVVGGIAYVALVAMGTIAGSH